MDKTTANSLVCTKGIQWNSNCNNCDTWRLLVWEDGGHEYEPGSNYNGVQISTEAGKYYGGHSPCTSGDNFPLCGEWDLGKYKPFILVMYLDISFFYYKSKILART